MSAGARAAGELPTYVACDDEQVATWAASTAPRSCGTPAWVNAAVNNSVADRDAGVTDVIVAHGDLPRAHDLAAPTEPGGDAGTDRRAATAPT